MSLNVQGQVQLFLAYLVFAGGLGFAAVNLVGAVAQESLVQAPQIAQSQPAEPSRVDRFLKAQQQEAVQTSRPLRRVVLAHALPDTPAPEMAAGLDRAESLPGEALELKARPATKRRPAIKQAAPNVLASAELRRKPKMKPGDLPTLVVTDAMMSLGLAPAKKKPGSTLRRTAKLETAREITYRNLDLRSGGSN